MKKRRNIPKLKSQIKFDKKIAQKASNIPYYKAQATNKKMYEFIESEKIRLSSPKWEQIDKLIEYYKKLGENKKSEIGTILLGIYNKNKIAALNNETITNHKLTYILSKPETLLLAYKYIKGNKGALNSGSHISKEDYNNLNNIQKELYVKSLTFPDKISLYDINLTSTLLKKGLYPWGTSSRVYVPKAGQPEKLRPITIPPFMDRIVQKAIELILTAIYEPYFEIRNRSFGFRPNKGTHDALIALLNYKTGGMKTAIEGDIEAAYNTVNKNILLQILSKKICDKKFLNIIKNRLQYEYLEKETNKRFTPDLGIPQGGIDSPYLFNIYLSEFDEFIHNVITEKLDTLNNKLNGTRKFNKNFNSVKAEKKKLIRRLNRIKTNLKKLPQEKENKKVKNKKNFLYLTIKKIRLNEHRKNRISSTTSNQKELKFFYVRYADDWIILTNGNKEIAKIIKNLISNFLKENLELKLSDKKTKITNITKEPAKFLGFELKISDRGAIRKKSIENQDNEETKKKSITHKVSGLLLWAQPDKQRLINRLHMKGYCTKNGFPKELPWLSTLEAHIIIERFNAIIRGLAQYYLPIIRNKSKLHRWIYILRYSCLKTLAQKYRISIKQIFQRFGHNMYSRSTQTIRIKVEQTVNKKIYYKYWQLITYKELIENKNHSIRKKELEKTFWDIELRKIIGEYPNKI